MYYEYVLQNVYEIYESTHIFYVRRYWKKKQFYRISKKKKIYIPNDAKHYAYVYTHYKYIKLRIISNS